MSERYPGGFITKTPPTLNPALGNSTPGVWTLDQVMQNIKAGTWPAYDPYFEYTTLLLHGNGTNGAQNNTFLDSSTNNFTITRNGNTTQGTFTPYGSNWSNYFNGSGDYLVGPTNNAFNFGTGDFTVEAWVCLTATPSADVGGNNVGSICTYTGGTVTANQGFEFYINSTGNQLAFASWGTGNALVCSFTAAIGTWYHIAVTRSSGVGRLFVNGVSQTLTTNTLQTNTDADATIRIGTSRGDTGYNHDFPGYISNLRIVKGTAVYTSAFTPPTAPLTAITNTSLLTCQSNRFIDNSSNAFAITVNGSPSVQRFSPFNPSAPYAAGTIGGSGYFDGSGDYLTVADNAVLEPGSSNFTIEAWIYPTASAAHAGIVCHYGGSGALAIAFDLATLTPQMNISSNGSTWDIASGVGSTAVSLYTWNHVAIVRNSNTFTIYVNGNSSGTATSSSSVANISSTWSIGANTGTGSEPLTGYISNARVVIGTAVYTANFTPPTAPLTAIANTQLLCSFTNGGIIDNAMMNDLETVGNAQISTTQSKFGGASMYFNSASAPSYAVTYNANAFAFGTGDLTIEAWIYPTQYTSDSEIVTFRTGGNVFFVIINSGNLCIHTNGYSPGLSYASFGAISLNTWTYIAITRVSGTWYGYINGNKSANNYSFATSLLPTNIRVGEEATNRWIGYIDDLRITKGYARYTANFTPQTSQWQDQ